MLELLAFIAGVICAIVFAAWRTRGTGTMKDALRRILPFGGGGPGGVGPR